MLRACFTLSLFALLSGVAIGGLLPFDLTEIKNLLRIVNPQSCGCALPPSCPIAIKGAHLVGFRCNQAAGFEFCCERRIPGTSTRIPNVKELKSMLPKGVTGNPQNEQVFKVAEEIAQEAVDSGKDLESLLLNDESATDIRIKPADTVVIPNVHNADRRDANANEPFCSCLLGHTCSIGGADFSFGKSCKFGSVRCCGQAVLEHIQSGGEERMETEMEKQKMGANAEEVTEKDNVEHVIKTEIEEEIRNEEFQPTENKEKVTIVTSMVHQIPINIVPAVQTNPDELNEVDQSPTVMHYSDSEFKRRMSAPVVAGNGPQVEEEELVTIVEPVETQKTPADYQEHQLSSQQQYEHQRHQHELMMIHQRQQGYFGQFGAMFEEVRKGVNSFFFG